MKPEHAEDDEAEVEAVNVEAETVSAADAVAETEGEAEAEADAVSETEAEGEGEGECEAESESESESESETEAEAETETEAEAETESDAETEAEAARALDPVKEEVLDSVVAALTAGRDPVAELEALLFSTHEPLTPEEIAATLGLGPAAVQEALVGLDQALQARGGPLGIFTRPKERRGRKEEGPPPMGFILDVRARYRRSVVPAGRPVLSPALTETLALIALNQPLPQARLVREKGSTVYEHVKELVAKGWVQKHKDGRSYALRTTEAFAAEFGLENDPELIKRALARAAGVQGAPELVGSERVRFEGDDLDLVAEAREVVPPPAPPTPAPAPEAAAAPEPEATPRFSFDGPPAIAPARPTRAISISRPLDDDEDEDEADECVVSGGEAPGRAPAPAPTRFADDEQADDEAAATAPPPPSRVAHLLNLLDDDSTTDDW